MKKPKMGDLLASFFAIELGRRFERKKLDYSNAFKSFHPSTVAIVKNLGPCILKKRNGHDEKMYYSAELINQLSCVYGMTPPRFFYKEEEGKETNGQYNVKEHSITMINKLSLVTLLHEFRHAMQYNGAKMVDQDKEEDARAWSMSLFKQAMPKSHKRACEKNLVKYQ